MKNFLIVFVLFTVLEVIGRLIFLANGKFPERTAASAAVEVFLNGAYLTWAVVLLVGVW